MMSSQKNEFEDENESFLPRHSDDIPTRHVEERSSRQQIIELVRILLEVGMAATIVFLLVSRSSSKGTRIRRSPVPDRKSLRSLGLEAQLTSTLVPRKIYKFRNDPQYIREDMFFNESATLHTLHNWIPLSSGIGTFHHSSRSLVAFL
jgi:hypothetical protein